MGIGITIDKLFYGAYREARLIPTAQVSLSADQMEEAREVWNKMVDALQLDGETVSHVARLLYNVVPGQGDYTVGPGGDFDPGQGISSSGAYGEIPSNYPVRIERASMVLTTNEFGGAGPPEYPIFPMTIDEWQTWTLKGQINNWPRRFYYEPSYPLGILHILYVPANTNQIALYLEQNIAAIDALGDALLDFRPGYQDALEALLGLRLARRHPEVQVSPELKEASAEAWRLIKTNNSRPLAKVNDMSGAARWRSNIYLGNRYSQ